MTKRLLRGDCRGEAVSHARIGLWVCPHGHVVSPSTGVVLGTVVDPSYAALDRWYSLRHHAYPVRWRQIGEPWTEAADG